ncbi:hypothetical protein QNI16_27055 [Cytophagaceae bacterium YF14B1]|uniref:Uncharacterized protein n=1 Tax=Xanthocytophaga flava TaxID=3048013 RepID=A0AAE3U9Z2_9BACT|nr:hypothetical protein [Xanthocytophaga flavus]MDJ1484187.1 hypothetical protein [Xanthocytophaga flavus]
MKRRITTQDTIRKYRAEYYRLRKQEARLNHELFRMKNRIKQLAEAEKQSIANHALLTDLLARTEQQIAELEAQPASKQRDKQLKKAEKELKDVHVKYKRSDLHLAVIDRKKDKDNAAKYILKETKRDDVTVRIQAAYETWQKFEQIQQQENTDFEAFAIQYQHQKTVVAEQLQASAVIKSSSQTSPRLVIAFQNTRTNKNAYFHSRFQSYTSAIHSEDDYLLFRQAMSDCTLQNRKSDYTLLSGTS